jgi:hypothetical protein
METTVLQGTKNYAGWKESIMTELSKKKLLKFVMKEKKELDDEDFSD